MINILVSAISTIGIIGLLIFAGPTSTDNNIIGMTYGYGYGYGYGYEYTEPSITSSSSSSGGSSHSYKYQDEIIKAEKEIIEEEIEEPLIEEEPMEEEKEEIIIEKKEKKSYMWLYIPLLIMIIGCLFYVFKGRKKE